MHLLFQMFIILTAFCHCSMQKEFIIVMNIEHHKHHHHHHHHNLMKKVSRTPCTVGGYYRVQHAADTRGKLNFFSFTKCSHCQSLNKTSIISNHRPNQQNHTLYCHIIAVKDAWFINISKQKSYRIFWALWAQSISTFSFMLHQVTNLATFVKILTSSVHCTHCQFLSTSVCD